MKRSAGQGGSSVSVLIAAAALLWIVSIATAAAQDAGSGSVQTPPFFEACKADIASFCKDTQPGEGRMMQCLNQSSGSLSAGCKTALPSQASSAKSTAAAGTPAPASTQVTGLGNAESASFFEACKADIASFCRDTNPGEGRMKQCLNQSSGSLSDGCKAALLSQAPSARSTAAAGTSAPTSAQVSGSGSVQPPPFFEACKDEIASLCTDVQPGGGRVLQCLNQHSGNLSAGCKASVPSMTPPK